MSDLSSDSFSYCPCCCCACAAACCCDRKRNSSPNRTLTRWKCCMYLLTTFSIHRTSPLSNVLPLNDVTHSLNACSATWPNNFCVCFRSNSAMTFATAAWSSSLKPSMFTGPDMLAMEREVDDGAEGGKLNESARLSTECVRQRRRG